MRVTDFLFTLPKELIAFYPPQQRTDCRLMRLDGNSGAIEHTQFTQLLHYIEPGDLLILNDTRVIPARLFGHKKSGGKVEVLIERVLDKQRALVQIKASKSPPIGSQLYLGEIAGKMPVVATVLQRHDNFFEILFEDKRDIFTILEDIGHIPLPPYIAREDTIADRNWYQTVYNRTPGAVAAPTAGLHFDDILLTALTEQGVEHAFVTLHVGAGTFQPIRSERIEDHRMHAEYVEVSPAVVDAIHACKARGKRVIAVGTTSVRALESAAQCCNDSNTYLSAFYGDTAIFIYPGYHYRVVDALITNFHLPSSTLLMLVCAFGGYQHVMHAYQAAIEAQYRFFSYGDAMFITHNKNAINENIAT